MNVSNNLRDRRYIFAPTHSSFASYSTDTKREMNNTFTSELILNKIYLGSDPLRKNLTDTIVPDEKMATKNKLDEKTITESEEKANMQVDNSRLSSITNFFSGVLNVISNAMFSRRKTDDGDECDCHNCSPEMSLPSMWHGAKITDENKILQDEITNDMSSEIFASEMGDCRSAATHCQNKLDHVRLLLGSSKPVPCSLRVRKRPKKVFVEPNRVEECFVDAFSPEDFENLANDSHIEYLSPVCYQEQVFHELECPNVKLEAAAPMLISEESRVLNRHSPLSSFNTPNSVTEKHVANDESLAFSEKSNTFSRNPNVIVYPKLDGHPTTFKEPLVCESTEIVNDVPEININSKLGMDVKNELVESCEEKMKKLKLLLQNRCIEPKIETAVNPLHNPKQKTYKVKDKRYKNPKRCIDKRKKSGMKKRIDDDMMFANEINSEELSSVENSPSMSNMENYLSSQKSVHKNWSQQDDVPCKEYFNEVSGRFQSSSVDSDDSFQIVFNDSPRYRRQSDCESDDSFIVFEDSPDSCYTSQDVFGDSTDSEDCDSDSDMSDSGCGSFKLTGSLSKSVNNLADDSLYEDHSEDEVDCANVPGLTMCDNATDSTCDTKGLLLNERKKLMRKHLPTKRVHFSTEPPKVHVMRVWLYAAKQTRQRYWEQFVVDRERFKRRINDVDMAVSWVLKPQHRSRVMFQRFMPWWNAQKRQEIADKKKREAEKKEKLVIKEVDRENIESNDDGELTVKNTSAGIFEANQKKERPVDVIERECDELHNQSEESTPADILEINDIIRKEDANKKRDQHEESTFNSLVKLKMDKTKDGFNVENKVSGEERRNNILNSRDIDCKNLEQNAQLKDNYKESKSMSIENTKSIKNYDKNNSQIVPLDLKQECVSGILNT